VPIDAVAPALHATVSGAVRVSVLTADPANPRKVTLTEFTWKAGAAPQSKKGDGFDIAAPIRSGTVAYSMSAVETPRRDWFFVLEDGRVQSSRNPKARKTTRQVPLPPQLLVMSQFSYCIGFFEHPRLISID
jgi:hypothetical protein